MNDVKMASECLNRFKSIIVFLHMEFGQKLKELRISLNTSQKELSEKTGLSIRTI
ncbi:hypothetical protein GCM10010831_24640 [Psychroflexus salis]|uniref:HTH cro/C1-type domain-containing protein n=1 Tax=Psychroflexus salis TaxID=1526574 RepID=A0A917A1S3_9FLAO|nr:hypothetical protein GCM10010831_24640 [Psychroflexus salis]